MGQNAIIWQVSTWSVDPKIGQNPGTQKTGQSDKGVFKMYFEKTFHRKSPDIQPWLVPV